MNVSTNVSVSINFEFTNVAELQNVFLSLNSALLKLYLFRDSQDDTFVKDTVEDDIKRVESVVSCFNPRLYEKFPNSKFA